MSARTETIVDRLTRYDRERVEVLERALMEIGRDAEKRGRLVRWPRNIVLAILAALALLDGLSVVGWLGRRYPARVFTDSTVSLSPDGRYALLRSPDSLRVVNVASEQTETALPFPSAAVNAALWSATGSRLLLDRMVTRYRIDSGPALDVDGSGRDLYWSADERLLVVVGDATVRLLDGRTGSTVCTIPIVARSRPQLDAKSAYLAVIGDSAITLYDARTCGLTRRIALPSSGFFTLEWRPDGTSFVLAGGDAAARIYDARTGVLRHVLGPHDQPVRSATWSHDGRRVAVFGDSLVSIFAPGTAASGERAISFSRSMVAGAAWSPDGRHLLVSTYPRDSTSAPETSRLFDVGRWTSHPISGRLYVPTYPGDPDGWRADGAAILGWSRFGEIALYDTTGRIIFQSTQCAPVGAFRWGRDRAYWATGQFSSSPTLCASTLRGAVSSRVLNAFAEGSGIASDGRVVTRTVDEVANVVTMATRRSAAAPISRPLDERGMRLAWSPDEAHLAIVGNRDVRLDHVGGGNMHAALALSVSDAAWRPDGSTIALVDSRGIAFIVDSSGTCAVSRVLVPLPPDSTRGICVRRLGREPLARTSLGYPVQGPSGPRSSYAPAQVAWSPDGRRFAQIVGDSAIVLLDATLAGEPVWLVPRARITAMAWSPDTTQPTLAVATMDGAVQTYRGTTPARRIETKGVTAITWNADGRLILLTAFDGSVRLWNTVTTEVREVLRNDSTSAAAASALFGSDGRSILVATSRGILIDQSTPDAWQRVLRVLPAPWWLFVILTLVATSLTAVEAFWAPRQRMRIAEAFLQHIRVQRSQYALHATDPSSERNLEQYFRDFEALADRIVESFPDVLAMMPAGVGA